MSRLSNRKVEKLVSELEEAVDALHCAVDVVAAARGMVLAYRAFRAGDADRHACDSAVFALTKALTEAGEKFE